MRRSHSRKVSLPKLAIRKLTEQNRTYSLFTIRSSYTHEDITQYTWHGLEPTYSHNNHIQTQSHTKSQNEQKNHIIIK